MDQSHKAKVLIVDDTPDNLKFLGSLLSSNGYETVVALNGHDALRYLEANSALPDLILLDIMMPEMDGYDVCKAIKTSTSTRDIPVIFLTAKTETEDIVSGFQTGAVDYVLKPFNSEELLARIDTHIQLKQARTQIVHLNKNLRGVNQELATLNESMEQIIHQQTLELKKANRRLEQLDQEKMVFLRYISHEMNTPLNFISATRILDKEALSDTDKEIVDIVEKGCSRLSDFVKEVINYFEFAREPIGKNKTQVLLAQIVESAITDSRYKKNDNTVSIEHVIEHNVTVSAEEYYLHQLISILIDNAVVYSAPGGSVTIYTTIDDSLPVLRVNDSGKGIKQENLNTIFKPFMTEEYDRREGGYGLNLPKAYVIAESHGWKLTAESSGIGTGARFSVLFVTENSEMPIR